MVLISVGPLTTIALSLALQAAVFVSDERVLICPEDMVEVESFCIDRYEAPNEAGAYPFVAQLASDGDEWCRARGKRLCTESEWVRACEGARKTKYPYGSVYQRGQCNDDKEWILPSWIKIAKYPAAVGRVEVARLYQADPSGLRTGCVSEGGVFDLTGNVAEWVTRSKTIPERTNYDHVLKGCFWSGCYREPQPNCKFTNRAHPGAFRTYEAGFRCCKS